MKHIKLLTSCIVLLFSNSTYAQTYFYGPQGKEYLNIHPNMIRVTFEKGIHSSQKARILAIEKQLSAYDPLLDIPHPNISLIQTISILPENKLLDLCQRLNALPEIAVVTPICIYADGTLQIPNRKLFARLRSWPHLELFKAYAAKTAGFQFNSISRDSLLIELTLRNSADQSAIALSNQLFELGWFEFAEPDFIRLLEPMHTSDPLITDQWALDNDGQNTVLYGGSAEADMNIYTAWATTTGSASIKVAVLDEGVDLQHPDLAQNLLPGYDATGQGSLGAANPADAHGTACAGIVAAVGNNGIGIAGVAYHSKVIPIRVAYRAANNWVTTNGWIADAINWAWDEGHADILSNSWGGGSPSSLINEAIDNALRFGRRGMGSPVVFAAGNHNGDLSYPASYPATIAVTAMSMCNERKSLTSCDGENWWGANYGPGIDIAAPGVKILTLDNSGVAGWQEGDYLQNFNGTSAACPNAAGVLALILSSAPDLLANEARFVLESTCDKVGNYNYSTFVPGQPAGTWSTALGYGRINAGKALTALACDNCLGCMDGTQNGQEEGIDCGGPNCLPCPTCNDGILNGDEEDIDCGGACTACICFDQVLQLTIQFDHYPEETSWEVRTPEGILVAAAGPFTEAVGLSTYTQEFVLPEGQYVFAINDSYGDGICCNYGDGNFQLKDSNGSSIIAGTEFTAAASVAFCVRASIDSCQDGIQNGEETGVDCGGHCMPCNDLACHAELIEGANFEMGWGAWNGETGVRRSELDVAFANSGAWCIRMAGLPNHSGLYSSPLDLSPLSELEIKFAFTTTGLEKMKEGLSLHFSSDAGKTFTQVAQWKETRDFVNDKPYLESVQLQGPFSANTVIRFQVDGSSRKDLVYIDDIFLSGCLGSREPLTNSGGIEASSISPMNLDSGPVKVVIPPAELSIFPNPSKGIIHVETKTSLKIPSQLQIFNTQGMMIYKKELPVKLTNLESTSFNLEQLPPGIYWLQISNNQGKQQRKFVIQR
ncbi:MAG: S8 family serine peptidase [Saprospiraceae bacterium]|nr:S8 family serine peptidase [Saprospiraceae bacterium]